MKMRVLHLLLLLAITARGQESTTYRPCLEVHSDFDLQSGCSQLFGSTGGARLGVIACRAKCIANSECKLWKANETHPWCWNFGNYGENGCHNVIFDNTVTSNIASGLSGCNQTTSTIIEGEMPEPTPPRQRFCLRKVKNVGSLARYPECCVHLVIRKMNKKSRISVGE
eukprot:TRINITY_DN2545_c0_g1_i3.p1 TRINITY_DN2545_c0_g1~~TRINITY_DN2545_c0_g1_i3.p1  ORF type:complete len:169 (-),score=21.53 TRINITY_DN2545_c0_g1_i3:83-589(-)